MSNSKTTNIAKRCGVQFNPAALIIMYEVTTENIKTKMKKRVMPVRHLELDADVHSVALDLQSKHLMDIEGMPLMKVEKMLRLIQEHLKGLSLPEALKLINKEFTLPVHCTDYNKVPQDVYRRVKEIMEIEYKKNAVGPEDPQFVYDKRVEFAAPRHQTEWDDTDDELDDFFGDVDD